MMSLEQSYSELSQKLSDLESEIGEMDIYIRTFEVSEEYMKYLSSKQKYGVLIGEKRKITSEKLKVELALKLSTKCDITVKYKVMVIDRALKDHHSGKKQGPYELSPVEIIQRMSEKVCIHSGVCSIMGYGYGIKAHHCEFPESLLKAFEMFDIKYWSRSGGYFARGELAFTGN